MADLLNSFGKAATGYVLIQKTDESILVGVGFSEFGKVAEEALWYKNQKYARGSLEAIPQDLCGTFCSMRLYEKCGPIP